MEEIIFSKQYLHNHFKIKDLGDFNFFLGFEVIWSSKGINIYQWKYTLDLVQDTGFLGCKPATTLMISFVKLMRQDRFLFIDVTSYRQLVGKLLYLTAWGLIFVIRFSSCLNSWMLLQRYIYRLNILFYDILKSMPNQGLVYPFQD